MLTQMDILGRIKFDLIICDEGHRLKNSQVKLNNALCSFSSTLRRIVVTGTPIQNDLIEFYNTLDFVNPGKLSIGICTALYIV